MVGHYIPFKKNLKKGIYEQKKPTNFYEALIPHDGAVTECGAWITVDAIFFPLQWFNEYWHSMLSQLTAYIITAQSKAMVAL